MSESTIPELLQVHGQSRGTGCISIVGTFGQAAIYLLDGDIVYGIANDYTGMTAVFLPMTWADPQTQWHAGENAPEVLFTKSVDEVLFEFAQLEDNHQAEEATLVELFGATAQGSGGESIKLVDLSQYDISFEVLNTAFKGFVFMADRSSLLVGRLEDCDVILPDASVSGHHCRILLEDYCIRVIDLGSTNGTTVNGELVTEKLIQVGDEFLVGAVALQMHMKMRRKLDQNHVAEHTGSISISAEMRLSKNTARLDTGALTRKTSKVTGPISWKNLTGEPPKKGNDSLFSKMFGKK